MGMTNSNVNFGIEFVENNFRSLSEKLGRDLTREEAQHLALLAALVKREVSDLDEEDEETEDILQEFRMSPETYHKYMTK